MAKASAGQLSLQEIAEYQEDTIDSLRSFFSPPAVRSEIRFLGATPAELSLLLERRAAETELRSCLVTLAAIEAAFKRDYLLRCTSKLKDPLSREFRKLYKTNEERVRLDEDLLRLWAQNHPGLGPLVSKLRGALKFRHWLAHGRYWEPKLGREWDFTEVYLLASRVLANFPLATD
jgi:hypothetical protein